jgi:hypothetical protein
MTALTRFEQIIRSDGDLMGLLKCLRAIALPEWRLVSGCLYQTVWNVLTRRPPGTGIQDYDLIYFDGGDVSWEAEDAVITRVTAAATQCIGPLQIRNQARVHLWYEQHFGMPYASLSSADEALSRYPLTVQAIGARLEDDWRLDVVAPFGLNDIFAMAMRPNLVAGDRSTYDAKVARARLIWPEVTVDDWNDP